MGAVSRWPHQAGVVYIPATKLSVLRMKHREEEPTNSPCGFNYVILRASCAALGSFLHQDVELRLRFVAACHNR